MPTWLWTSGRSRSKRTIRPWRPVRILGAAPAPDADSRTAVEAHVEPPPDPAAGAGRQGRETAHAPSPEPGAPVRHDRAAAEAVAWAMTHLSEREAVFSRTDLLAAALAYAPGTLAVEAVEREVAELEKAGALHAVSLPGARDSLATDRTVGEERETVALMRAGAARGKVPMRRWAVQEHLHKGPLTAGQKDAVTLILAAKDRVIGVQGYAGTGKTTMLDRARTLAEKRGWRMLGLAPSASAVKTLATEAGIESQTLQGFLARNAGVAAGRLTKRGAREMRAAFAKTILVVDEGSLTSTVQARDLLRIASELRIPRVVLVGDAKQLDAVDAGKPFAQLQAAGMRTAVMDEILRQRDPALKEAVEASLRGEIHRAFDRLGANVTAANGRDIAGTVAAHWLALPPEAREKTGVMAPSHELRLRINGHIREALAREGRLQGPATEVERLVSKGYTQAEKALADNYAPGDVVAFYRPYKRIGIEKGEERRVVGVDGPRREVLLDDGRGGSVAWKPSRIGGGRGGTEVYRTEGIELRAGDRIRWTRNDAGLGVVNSRTAEVLGVRRGRVVFQLEDGRRLELAGSDPQLRHLDHAWASTVHAYQGRTVDNVIAAIEARHPHLTTQKSFYVEISRARDRAELVTDDVAELRAQLQAVTGERIAALEGIGEMPREVTDGAAEVARVPEKAPVHGTGREAAGERSGPGRRLRSGNAPHLSAAGTPERSSICESGGRQSLWISAATTPSRPSGSGPRRPRMNRKPVRRTVDEDGRNERQTPRTIRFYDCDWERIETFALMRGMTATELIRATVLAAIGEAPAATGSGCQLAPQIARMFRYTHILATAMRNEMLREGRGDELEELVRSARELQDKLSNGSTD